MSKGKVLMAMSGGIDSSIAAILLLEQGYELVGATFRTYDAVDSSGLAHEKKCSPEDSIMEAKHLAEQLGIEHHVLDFRQTFQSCVMANFVAEYMQGRTPNPCVLCNSHIKWGKLIEAADGYGCTYIATGHYAQIAEYGGHYFLKNAVDTHKDQTYFLWMLAEENLRRTLFPLGGLEKTEVRNIAAAHDFTQLSQKKESQEICFVPNNDYRSFLASKGCEFKEGNYVDSTGRILGRHAGYANYTIGQRKGLGIALGTPQFVTHIDATNNEVTLGTHDDLFSSDMHILGLRSSDLALLTNGEPIDVRIRYRSKPVAASIVIDNASNGAVPIEGLHAKIHFIEPVWGITPGQSAVMYRDNMVIGGGIIEG